MNPTELLQCKYFNRMGWWLGGGQGEAYLSLNSSIITLRLMIRS